MKLGTDSETQRLSLYFLPWVIPLVDKSHREEPLKRSPTSFVFFSGERNFSNCGGPAAPFLVFYLISSL